MPRSTTYNPLVLAGKTLFLQRVQDAVSDGYVFYTSGTVPILKAPKLVRRFKDLYLVHLDKNSRYRRKKQDLGNARLLLKDCPQDPTCLDFILLVSSGQHPAHQLEKLQDVRKGPLAYGELELVLLTLKGRDKPTRTWRLNAKTVEGWQQRLHLDTVHYNKLGLFNAWFSLYRTPGFAGARRQVGELIAYWRSEWRQHRRDEPCPMSIRHEDIVHRARPGVRKADDGMYWTKRGFPSSAQLPKLFYVRKQPDCGDRLSYAVRREQERLLGDAPVPAGGISGE